MKKINLVTVLLILIPSLLFSQTELEEIQTELEKMNEKFDKMSSKNIQFGLSLGYRFLTSDARSIYQRASISPIDSTLQLEEIDDGAIILSSSILFNPRFNTGSISRSINAKLIDYVVENNRDKKLNELTINESKLFEGFAIDTSALIGSMTNIALIQNSDDDLQIDAISSLQILSELSARIRITKNGQADDFTIKELKRKRRSIRRLVFARSLIDYLVDRISLNANLNLIEFSNAQTDFAFNRSLEGGLGVSYMLNRNIYIGINWDVFFSRQLTDHLKEFENRQLHINGEVITTFNDEDIENNNLFITRNINGISFKIITSF